MLEGSLPHRQLRKFTNFTNTATMRSLPHRQLRKVSPSNADYGLCSLPHRQLRKVTLVIMEHQVVFTAAQAA